MCYGGNLYHLLNLVRWTRGLTEKQSATILNAMVNNPEVTNEKALKIANAWEQIPISVKRLAKQNRGVGEPTTKKIM